MANVVSLAEHRQRHFARADQSRYRRPPASWAYTIWLSVSIVGIPFFFWMALIFLVLP